MADQYNTAIILWLLLVLIGCWLLTNALIDIGARWMRRWIRTRYDQIATTRTGEAASSFASHFSLRSGK